MKLLFTILIFFASNSWAQTAPASKAADGAKSTDAMAVSVFTGPLLPNHIDGVTEIQSSWGARLAKAGKWVDFYELGFLISNTKGISLFDYFLSAKIEVETHSFLTQLYAGVDYFSYESDTEDNGTVGIHFGTALLARINETWSFRTDMKLNFEPGNSLFIGFGLEHRF